MTYTKRFLLIALIVVVILVLRFVGIEKYLSFDAIKTHADELRQLVHAHYTGAVLFFIATYVAAIALFLPVGALLTMTGGFLFGTIPGAVYTNIGATIGSIIAFLITRYLIGDFVQERYKTRLVVFNEAMHKYGAWYLLVIHLVAIIPFSLVNLLTGMTRVSLWTFVWTTSLGILPGSLIYAYAGQQLTTINSFSDVWSLRNVFWLLVLLKVTAVTPLVVSKLRDWHTKRRSRNS